MSKLNKLMAKINELHKEGKISDTHMIGLRYKFDAGDETFLDNFIKRINGEREENQLEQLPPKKEKKNKSTVKKVPEEEEEMKIVITPKKNNIVIKEEKKEEKEEELKIKPKGSEEKDFENNKVLLWGIREANKKLLKKYFIYHFAFFKFFIYNMFCK